VRLPDWSRSRRVVVGRRCLGEVSKEVAGTFWDEAKHEFEAYVTGLPAGEVNAWQVIELYQQRADTENVFDELKHQWGLEGFCCRKRNATALAARLGLLFYNLWHLFLRLLEPGRHVESAGGRRWFLLIAARLVQSGRQKTLQVSVSGKWWEQLRAGYERVCAWLAATAPQLKSQTLAVPVPTQIGAAIA
jgi:DNA-directed RNA polymerase subunit N (RpoN/RPB10)